MSETANFPTTITTQLHQVEARTTTYLTNEIDNSQLNIAADTTGFPAKGFITIESETNEYLSLTALQFNVVSPRGYAGTAVSHLAGKAIKLSVAAATMNRVIAEVTAIETALKNDITGLAIATGAEVTTGTDNTKIVTPKAIGDSKVLARAYLNGAQDNLNNNEWTKVLLDTESYDVGGNFAAYKFVAPVAGYYQVNGTVNFKNIIADQRYSVALYVGGAPLAYNFVQSSIATQQISASVSDIYYLSVSQYVELYCCASCGVNTVDLNSGTNFTFMSIFKF